jgi:hypothetical protein
MEQVQHGLMKEIDGAIGRRRMGKKLWHSSTIKYPYSPTTSSTNPFLCVFGNRGRQYYKCVPADPGSFCKYPVCRGAANLGGTRCSTVMGLVRWTYFCFCGILAYPLGKIILFFQIRSKKIGHN